MKLIGRVTGEYKFDGEHDHFRHIRNIDIMKTFDNPIAVEKWGQVQRIELVDDNDFCLIRPLIKIEIRVVMRNFAVEI